MNVSNGSTARGAERLPWWLPALFLIAWATLAPQPGLRARSFSFCLLCDANWLGDTINNVALFMPLGAALAFRGTRVGKVVLAGAAISCLVELLQRAGIAPGRIPALDDVLANSVGTALGAWGMTHRDRLRRTLWQVTAARARGLLMAWTLAVGGMLWGSAWGVVSVLSSDTASRRDSVVVADSWQRAIRDQDFVQSTIRGSVNDVRLPVKRTGQIMASISPTDTVRIDITRRLIDERDRRDRPIALVFVHGRQSSDELVYLGQEREDLVLRRTVRATRLGLQTPTLRLRNVFVLDSVLPGTTSSIHALVTPSDLSLRIDVPDPRIGSKRAELRSSSALGWALIQPLIGATSPVAPLLTCLWLLCWFLPGGVWVARAGGAHVGWTWRGHLLGGAGAAIWSLALLLGGALAATALGVHQMAWWQNASAVAGAILGVVIEARGRSGSAR